MSVSYGQFSLNRDCIAHWLHVQFAPLLLQNQSINFFLSLVVVGPINSLQCGTMHVKVLFMSGSDPIFPRLSGVKTVQCIRTKFSGWIDPTGGRVILYFSGVHDARGTWHVPPREGLHKLLANPAGQTGGPPTPNLQVTCIQPQRVCFCGCRSCGVQAARARVGKLF